MTVRDLPALIEGNVAVQGDDSRQVTGVYCCDMLSHVMGRAPADSAWVTVMGGVNAIAVSALADTACIIIAEGLDVDADAAEKAAEQGISVLRTPLPIFEAAKRIDKALT